MAVIFGDISAVGGAGSPPAQPKLLSDMRHIIQFDINFCRILLKVSRKFAVLGVIIR